MKLKLLFSNEKKKVAKQLAGNRRIPRISGILDLQSSTKPLQAERIGGGDCKITIQIGAHVTGSSHPV